MKQKKKRNAGLITKFLPYYKPYIGIMSFDMFCAALTTVCELVLPMVVRTITNAASGEDLSALTPTLILGIGGMYVLLRIIDTAANYFMTSVGHIMGTKIETDMRRDLFSHLQKLSFSYYDNTKVGTLMSRMTTDLFDVTEFAHHCPEEFFIAGVKIIGAFILLCTINVPLTLIIFSVIPLILAFSIFFRRRMRSNFRESRKQIGELNSQIEDSLLGIRVTRSFAREDEEKRKFGIGNCEYLRIKSERYRIMGAFHSSTRLFDGLMYIIVVVAGALFMMGIGNLPTITPPDYIAYLMFVSTLLTSIRRIVEFSEQFQQGISGIERFQEILETEPEIQDAPNATDLCDVKGHVEFRDVSFRYETETQNVLTHLDLDVYRVRTLHSSGPRVAAKQRFARSFLAFTRYPRAIFWWMARIFVRSRFTPCATASVWLHKTFTSFRAVCAKILPMERWMPPMMKLKPPPKWQVRTNLFHRFPMGIIPMWANAASSFRADKSNVSRLPVCSSKIPRFLFLMKQQVLLTTRVSDSCNSRLKSLPRVARPLPLHTA